MKRYLSPLCSIIIQIKRFGFSAEEELDSGSDERDMIAQVTVGELTTLNKSGSRREMTNALIWLQLDAGEMPCICLRTASCSF